MYQIGPTYMCNYASKVGRVLLIAHKSGTFCHYKTVRVIDYIWYIIDLSYILFWYLARKSPELLFSESPLNNFQNYFAHEEDTFAFYTNTLKYTTLKQI